MRVTVAHAKDHILGFRHNAKFRGYVFEYKANCFRNTESGQKLHVICASLARTATLPHIHMSLDKASAMDSTTAKPSAKQTGDGAADIKTSLLRLNREDSWYWWNAVLVIMLLMGAIVVLSLPRLLQGDDDPFFQLQLTVAVRGLLGLVLIFNVYTLYQQHLLRQLRHHLAGQIEIATEQRVRAEALNELAILYPSLALQSALQ